MEIRPKSEPNGHSMITGDESQRHGQVRIPGDILCLDLGDGFYAYCRVLEGTECEFFGIRTKGAASSIDEILEAEVAFTVSVSDDPIVSGQWCKIGHLSLETRPPCVQIYFHQDLGTNRVHLIEDGVRRSGTREEAHNLERAAVWDRLHIEDRLRDLFSGRRNKWVEQLRVK